MLNPSFPVLSDPSKRAYPRRILVKNLADIPDHFFSDVERDISAYFSCFGDVLERKVLRNS